MGCYNEDGRDHWIVRYDQSKVLRIHLPDDAHILAAAIGGTFEFARVAAANLREKDDAYNQAIGGFFAGGIVGFRSQYLKAAMVHHVVDSHLVRSFPAVIGYGAALATLQGVFEYTGGKLNGYEADSSVDQYERKEQLRRNRRRPIEETLQELGEGRGRSCDNCLRQPGC